MIIARPRWETKFIQVLSRAITDVVTAPSHQVKLAINGLVYRHQRSGFFADREMYYNFRQDGAEAFNYYNYAIPAGAKDLKDRRHQLHCGKSICAVGGTAIGYTTQTGLLGLDGIYIPFP